MNIKIFFIKYTNKLKMTQYLHGENNKLESQQPLIFYYIQENGYINIFILLCLFNFYNENKLFTNINYFIEIEKYKDLYFKGSNLNAKQKKYNKKFYNTIKFFYYDNETVLNIINNIFDKNIKTNSDSTNNYELVLNKIFNFNHEIIKKIKEEIINFCEKNKEIIITGNICEFNDLIENFEKNINQFNIIDNFNVKHFFYILYLINIVFINNIFLVTFNANNLNLDNKNKIENKTLQLICVQQQDSSIFYYYYKNINDNEWFFSNNFYDNNSKINIGTFQDVIKHDERINNNNKNYNLFYFNLQ